MDDHLNETPGPDLLWTNVNTAEALPGVLTPLSWNFWRVPLELAMVGSFIDMGVLPRDAYRFHERPDERYSAAFYGRFCANVQQLRKVGDAMPGTTADAVEEQIFGTLRSGNKAQNQYSRYPVVAAKLPVAATKLPKLMHALRAQNNAWWPQATSPATIADLDGARDRFVEAIKRFGDVMRPHCVATMLAQAMYDQLQGLAKAAGKPGLETRLATGYGDMEEVQLAGDLWDCSRGRIELSEFVSRHGYHGPAEGALQSHSWREDQVPLTNLMGTYRKRADDQGPKNLEQNRRAERLEAQRELLGALPWYRREGAKLVLKLAARHIPLREVGKAAFLQAIDVGRAAARSHGQWLVDQGALEAPDDVFFITDEELIQRRTDGLRELVTARRAGRDQFIAVKLPDTWIGVPQPSALADVVPTERTDVIKGLAVAPGVVEGRARVVEDPEAGIDLDDGEILVCETTDPSWASFFVCAGAVVIDIGGAMSHGAIVAREMGIPCVINTRIGTSTITTGDLLRVDGSAGVITVLERVADTAE